ncbi:DUF4336 domain-containing protein [Pseudorhodobacter sp.]|uniref:DUF4336 domain-containing protein n=1 Tax=Pseudorhodobacter sp. TaxID=1934400 RepID=UPI002648DC84|nr:DUF4336 domain-containing protein [Pseudorhodobacter sp.]MDN5785500.1 DUF4336 domain-containing protein [Pseudorhodobacter sp.]
MNEPVFEPYSPLNQPKPVAPDVWVADGPEIRMRYLGGTVPFPTRMTILRLPGGGLWLHSPTEPTEALFDAVARLGPIEHIIAPNTLHYWWVPEWHQRFPEARLHAVPGLAKRATRDLPPMEQLGEVPDPAWAGVIEQVIVPGGLLSEVDFFHRPSKTLILTDLIENFEPKRVRSRFWRWTMQAFGAADPDGKAPFDMRLSFWRHRKPLRRAVQQMIDWSPERVLLAHGRWYDRDGTEELRRAFRWVV